MNIVLVISDTFRYDNLSCYGPTQAITPRLDRFAQQAFVFTHAYLGSFPTIPNRLDIMSGRFSCLDHEWCPLPPDTVTIQQVLEASGYVTQLIADNPHMFEDGFNYERGFTGFEWIRGQESDRWETAPREIAIPQAGSKNRAIDLVLKRYLRNTAWWQSEEDRFAARTIQAACKWLERNWDQDKFFLWIDLFDPHEPWDPPRQYVDLYPTRYSGPDIIYPHYDFWRNFLTEEELEHVRALYLGEVSLVDHWVGVLLDKLDELGLTEDTAVIFTSDHGYLFGEHDLTGKSLQPEHDGVMTYEAVPLYNEIRRIPLLIRLPGQTTMERVDALVQPPDLMPTILEMGGIVATEQIAGRAQIKALQCGVFYTERWQFSPELIHGRSLMPLLRGETSEHRDLAVASCTLVHHTPHMARCAIVTTDGWCLHYSGAYAQAEGGGKLWQIKLVDPEGGQLPTAPALYYLPEDPGETNDRIAENEALAREIHARYVGWLEEAGTPEQHLAGRRALRGGGRRA